MFFASRWGGKNNHLMEAGKFRSKILLPKNSFSMYFDPKHLKIL